MKTTVIVLYCPGSSPVNMDFQDEFSDILERLKVFTAPLINAGDVNIHLDVPSIYSMRFKEILLDFDLVQHASGPTHVAGHTLDIMITHRSLDDATAVSIEPPVISDHSLISCQITTKHVEQCQQIILKRKWKKFDIDMFRQELELIVNPPPDNNDLVQSYNRVLKELLDKHAPPSSTKVQLFAPSPWHNAECREIIKETRRLERIYRLEKSEVAGGQWREQFDLQWVVFQRIRSEYWSSAIRDSPDSKTLWRRLNCLLHLTDASTCPHSPEAFANFFDEKIEAVRQNTANTPQPVINTRSIPPFHASYLCSIKEVTALIQKATNKQCQLDPIPTRVLKQCCDLLAPAISAIINNSFTNGEFPNSLKSAIVRPIIKKTNMDLFWCCWIWAQLLTQLTIKSSLIPWKSVSVLMASLSIGSNHTWISDFKCSMLELEHPRPCESSMEYRRGPSSV